MTSVQKADKGRKNGIGDFFVGVIDRDVMVAYIQDNLGGFPFHKLDETSDPETLALALLDQFRKDIPVGDPRWLKCDHCHGEGPDAPTCPYCGSRGEAEAPAAPVAGKKKKKKATGDVAEGVATKQNNEPAVPAKGETTMAATAEVIQDTGAKGSKKKAKVAPDLKPSGAMVKVGKAGALDTVKTLDAGIAEVQRLKLASVSEYYKLALKVTELNKTGLWKLRLDTASGKQRYASWESFVTNELGMSPDYTYNLMQNVARYSQEEMAVLGPTRAALILKVAEADQPALKEKAIKDGLSVREVRKQVHKVKKRTGHTGSGPKAKQGAAGAKATAAKHSRASEKITIAVMDGKKTINMFQHPASLRNFDWSKGKRATKMSQTPIGRIELTNDAEMILKITQDERGFRCTYEITRK